MWRIDTPKSSSTQAYERLRQAIIRGEFQPGERLTEVTTASLLGVSRTPVREAFARLTMDGLMRSSDSGGMQVVDPRQEITAIYHIREAIEGCAARLAALYGSDEELDHIVELAEASRRTDPSDVKTRARLNDEFHMAIAKASRAPRVERLVGDYRELFVSARALRRFTPAETEEALGAHQRIARAIRSRDGDAAERAIRAHLQEAYSILLKHGDSPGAATADEGDGAPPEPTPANDTAPRRVRRKSAAAAK